MDFRGASEFIYRGQPKFDDKEPLQFSLRMNYTSSCQVPIIGRNAKILISFSTFKDKTFLREYTHEITSAAAIKKKYDDHMDDLEGQLSEEERENSRKRRRTSNY